MIMADHMIWSLAFCIYITSIKLFFHYHNFDYAMFDSLRLHRMLRSKVKNGIVCLFLFETARKRGIRCLYASQEGGAEMVNTIHDRHGFKCLEARLEKVN